MGQEPRVQVGHVLTNRAQSHGETGGSEVHQPQTQQGDELELGSIQRAQSAAQSYKAGPRARTGGRGTSNVVQMGMGDLGLSLNGHGRCVVRVSDKAKKKCSLYPISQYCSGSVLLLVNLLFITGSFLSNSFSHMQRCF